MNNKAEFLRNKPAAEFLGIGLTKLHYLETLDPTFPKKTRITCRYVGWKREQLEQWLNQQIERSATGGKA
jgi:predicted DNA-binding transcriptional regulator AlpA